MEVKSAAWIHVLEWAGAWLRTCLFNWIGGQEKLESAWERAYRGVVKEETGCSGLWYISFQGCIQGESHSRQKPKEMNTERHPW